MAVWSAAPALNNVPAAPGGLDALEVFGSAHGGLPQATAELAHLRAGQLNGSTGCVRMHARDLRQAGESDERIRAVGQWRDAPCFTDAERAALALTEAVTRTAEVPDEILIEAARHFDEPALAALILHITLINAWNRLEPDLSPGRAAPRR